MSLPIGLLFYQSSTFMDYYLENPNTTITTTPIINRLNAISH